MTEWSARAHPSSPALPSRCQRRSSLPHLPRPEYSILAGRLHHPVHDLCERNKRIASHCGHPPTRGTPMAAMAELGRLCLSHSRAEMQLIADVALTASSPLTYTREASTTDLSAALTAPHAWLCRGQGFHLALHISLDGYQLHDHLQRYLAHSICNADASSFP